MAIRKISIGIAVVVVVAGGLLAGAWFTLGGGKPSSPSSQPNDTATKAEKSEQKPEKAKPKRKIKKRKVTKVLGD